MCRTPLVYDFRLNGVLGIEILLLLLYDACERDDEVDEGRDLCWENRRIVEILYVLLVLLDFSKTLKYIWFHQKYV